MKRRARSRARFASMTEKLRTTQARAAIRTKSWSWRPSVAVGKKAHHDPRARGRRNSRQRAANRVPLAGIAGHNRRFRLDCNCSLQLYVQSDFVGIAPLWPRAFVARVFVCRLADV